MKQEYDIHDDSCPLTQLSFRKRTKNWQTTFIKELQRVSAYSFENAISNFKAEFVTMQL